MDRFVGSAVGDAFLAGFERKLLWGVIPRDGKPQLFIFETSSPSTFYSNAVSQRVGCFKTYANYSIWKLNVLHLPSRFAYHIDLPNCSCLGITLEDEVIFNTANGVACFDAKTSKVESLPLSRAVSFDPINQEFGVLGFLPNETHPCFGVFSLKSLRTHGWKKLAEGVPPVFGVNEMFHRTLIRTGRFYQRVTRKVISERGGIVWFALGPKFPFPFDTDGSSFSFSPLGNAFWSSSMDGLINVWSMDHDGFPSLRGSRKCLQNPSWTHFGSLLWPDGEIWHKFSHMDLAEDFLHFPHASGFYDDYLGRICSVTQTSEFGKDPKLDIMYNQTEVDIYSFSLREPFPVISTSP